MPEQVQKFPGRIFLPAVLQRDHSVEESSPPFKADTFSEYNTKPKKRITDLFPVNWLKKMPHRVSLPVLKK